jgi:4-hydroxy-2-oxoheptanedioate aldolase
MRPNRLKQKMQAQQPGLVNGWLVLGSPAIAELFSCQPWDSITIDMQHGLADFETTVSMLRAMADSEATPMVRVPWLESGIIQRVLDAGAYGIICPMVNNRSHCELFVSACRYAPQGKRSFGPTRAPLYAKNGDYWRQANDTILTFAMIETREAVECIDDIVSVDGLDGVYIGPSDLALTLGLHPIKDMEHPTLLAAVDHIHARTQAAGKFTVMHCSPIEVAQRMADRGFSLRTVSNDNRLLTLAMQDLFKAVGR